MRRRGRIFRRVAASFALFSVSACEPKKTEIKACTVDGKLAFEIADTKGWFSETTARPWSATVYEPDVGPAWDTQVANDLIEDKNHTYQPPMNIIVYGISFNGWEVETKPQPLKFDVDYEVRIWSDGGLGELRIKGGRLYPTCNPADDFEST